MIVSLELLFHHNAIAVISGGLVADIHPNLNISVHCPHCGEVSKIEGMQNGDGKAIQGVAYVYPPTKPLPMILDSDND